MQHVSVYPKLFTSSFFFATNFTFASNEYVIKMIAVDIWSLNYGINELLC